MRRHHLLWLDSWTYQMGTQKSINLEARNWLISGSGKKASAPAAPSSGSSPSAGWTAAKSSVTDWKGYDVLQGGPSEQYKAPKSYIGRRFVSNTAAWWVVC